MKKNLLEITLESFSPMILKKNNKKIIKKN